MTHFWMWLNTTTIINISLMAWLGILAALGMLGLATIFIVYLIPLDGQIGKSKA
jgi:hypothetical protein